MVSYDPDEIPDVSQKAWNEAVAVGLKPVHVICDEPGAVPGDVGGVSFIAFCDFVPRTGDRVTLEDDTVCEVVRIHYKVATSSSGSGMKRMTTNVYAVRVSNR